MPAALKRKFDVKRYIEMNRRLPDGTTGLGGGGGDPAKPAAKAAPKESAKKPAMTKAVPSGLYPKGWPL